MDIGDLKKTVTFKVNTPVASTTGGFTDSFSTLLTTKGHLRKKGGSRSLQSGEIEINDLWQLTVRYQSTLETSLSQSVIVEIDSRVFTVQAWEKLEEKNFYYLINLNEKRG